MEIQAGTRGSSGRGASQEAVDQSNQKTSELLGNAPGGFNGVTVKIVQSPLSPMTAIAEEYVRNGCFVHGLRSESVSETAEYESAYHIIRGFGDQKLKRYIHRGASRLIHNRSLEEKTKPQESEGTESAYAPDGHSPCEPCKKLLPGDVFVGLTIKTMPQFKYMIHNLIVSGDTAFESMKSIIRKAKDIRERGEGYEDKIVFCELEGRFHGCTPEELFNALNVQFFIMPPEDKPNVLVFLAESSETYSTMVGEFSRICSESPEVSLAREPVTSEEPQAPEPLQQVCEAISDPGEARAQEVQEVAPSTIEMIDASQTQESESEGETDLVVRPEPEISDQGEAALTTEQGAERGAVPEPWYTMTNTYYIESCDQLNKVIGKIDGELATVKKKPKKIPVFWGSFEYLVGQFFSVSVQLVKDVEVKGTLNDSDELLRCFYRIIGLDMSIEMLCLSMEVDTITEENVTKHKLDDRVFLAREQYKGIRERLWFVFDNLLQRYSAGCQNWQCLLLVKSFCCLLSTVKDNEKYFLVSEQEGVSENVKRYIEEGAVDRIARIVSVLLTNNEAFNVAEQSKGAYGWRDDRKLLWSEMEVLSISSPIADLILLVSIVVNNMVVEPDTNPKGQLSKAWKLRCIGPLCSVLTERLNSYLCSAPSDEALVVLIPHVPELRKAYNTVCQADDYVALQLSQTLKTMFEVKFKRTTVEELKKSERATDEAESSVYQLHDNEYILVSRNVLLRAVMNVYVDDHTKMIQAEEWVVRHEYLKQCCASFCRLINTVEISGVDVEEVASLTDFFAVFVEDVFYNYRLPPNERREEAIKHITPMYYEQDAIGKCWTLLNVFAGKMGDDVDGCARLLNCYLSLLRPLCNIQLITLGLNEVKHYEGLIDLVKKVAAEPGHFLEIQTLLKYICILPIPIYSREDAESRKNQSDLFVTIRSSMLNEILEAWKTHCSMETLKTMDVEFLNKAIRGLGVLCDIVPNDLKDKLIELKKDLEQLYQAKEKFQEETEV